MIAFVLSGGGNRGPLEVGTLQVLLEHGIRADILVGTSAGTINAVFLAIDPTPGGALHLGEMMIEEGRRQGEAYLRASQAVTRTERLSFLGERLKGRLKTAIRRLQGIRTRKPHGFDEKMEPHSGTFGVRL